MYRSLTATALGLVLIAMLTLDSRPASADEDYDGFIAAITGAAVLGALTIVPVFANAVELGDGYGSPPGWTVYGVIGGGLQVVAGAMVAKEWEADGAAVLLIALGTLNLGLAVVGALDYVPPEERLSVGPVPVLDQRGRLAPGVGLSWQF